MKVFLIFNDKIMKYTLPSRVDDSFLITYNNKKLRNCLITFVGRGNEWYLKSNGTVNIIDNNQEINEIKVEPYYRYALKVVGQDEIIEMYFAPLQETLFKLTFENLNEFTVGSGSTCHLCYDSNNLTGIEAMFKLVGNDWVISTVNDENYKVYINNNRATLKTLKIGDIIFIGGLKIIWMKNYIYINNPNNALKVSGMKLVSEEEQEESNILPVLEDDKYVELYNKDDYFIHFPTIKETISDKELVIDAPPNEEKENQMPFILTMGSTIVMVGSSFMMGYNVVNNLANGKEITSLIPQIVMCITMLIGSLIIPQVSKAYQKRKRLERETLRQDKYTEYLQSKEREMQLFIKNELNVLSNNYLDLDNCLVALDKKDQNFWRRQNNDSEFLCIRVGVGKVESAIHVKAPERHFSLEKDNLLEETYKLSNKYNYVDGAPVVVNLKESMITSLICASSNKDYFINNIIAQLIILQSSVDLKIVLFTQKESAEKFDYLKYIPHIFADDASIRFFAAEESEYKYVSNYLEEILKTRKENSKNNQVNNLEPHYLIITDDYLNVKNIPIIDELVNKDNTDLGFSLLVIEDNMKHVPVSSKTFIQVGDKDGVILEKQTGLNSQRIFYLDRINKDLDMQSIANKLFNTPIKTVDGPSVLPTSLSFLDMFGVSKIEQLNILNRWQTNNPVISLETTVGVHPNGDKFKMDLHEKYHGPHGLIAGSTGSGKSEFIITFILSMAIEYHPYEVQFVLIDYKGGGLAGAFENKETGIKIPHLVGTITNLDASSLNRSLMSIQSEVMRRQRIFNETKESLGEGTIDIYKYQKLYREGVVKSPLAHLFIICDEFAELKQQQPEFMEQLISISRIGRSLGIHLILATQKPSGVVNDQIWANSKFKVCLKVQDKSDSMEMLKRPEAASIKETGRFYLQVGYDELFEIGQSGWSGAKYMPSDKIIIKVDESINFINNVGYVLKSVKEKTEEDTKQNYGDQLTNIVKYLSSLGSKENIITRKLWLDALPEIIYMGNLKQKYNYKPVSYYINPVIGEYDDPVNQRQGLLNLDLSKKGNALIYGVPGSGKESLLTNIIRSSIVEHTPDEVNIYILDCGSEALRIFNNYPHVGNVLTIEDDEEITDLFKMVQEEIEKRKDLFADYAGNYNDYILSSGAKLPTLLIIINNYDAFTEGHADKVEALQSLFRDGSKYGIIFVVSVNGTNSMRSRSISYFNNKICLHLNDQTDYHIVLNSPRELLPADYFGRGITNVDGNFYEFQTATFAEKQDQTNSLRELCDLLNKSYTTRAKKIPTIPKRVYVDTMFDKIVNSGIIPIGYNMDNKKLSYVDFAKNKVSVITYNNISSDKIMFITSLLTLTTKNSQSYLIDLADIITKDIPNVQVIKDKYNTFFEYLKNGSNNDIYLFITGIGTINNKMDITSYEVFKKLINSISSYPYLHIVLIDATGGFRTIKIESWFNMLNINDYIFLGEGINNQMVFLPPNMDFGTKKKTFPCMGYIVKNGKYELIKHIVDGEEVNE